MAENKSLDALRELIGRIKNKRPRTVAEHIIEHGFITTEQLEELYGYKHPPRAARDLREAGIPLETFRVKNREGRSIAAYRFGDLSKVRRDRLSGRRVFSKQFKGNLVSHYGNRCHMCQTEFEGRYLQVDHRVPYEVAGDDALSERDPEEYMLLCGECNRAKSWSCEHCPNWRDDKLPEVCLTCYWAKPETYKHVALRQIRRLDIVWTDDEVELYDKLKAKVEQLGVSMPEYVKKLLHRGLAE